MIVDEMREKEKEKAEQSKAEQSKRRKQIAVTDIT